MSKPLTNSFFGKCYSRINLLQNYTNNPDWGKVDSSIDINSQEDYKRKELIHAYQVEFLPELFEKVEFSSFSYLGEIGGSPFVQSKFALNTFPNLKALLTDRHEVYWQSIAKLEILPRTKFDTFDALTDDLSLFEECDILWMWGVDLFYDDERLLNLFDFVKKHEIKLVIGSHSVEHLKYSPKRILFNGKTAKNRLREVRRNTNQPVSHLTGVYRTSHYYRRLSKLVNVSHSDLGTHNSYRVHIFN